MNIKEIFTEFEKNDLIEDRSEYTPEDFMNGYNLSKEDAQALYEMVQNEVTPVCKDENLKKFIDTPKTKLKSVLLEYFAESEHQNWEGYERSDLIGIRKFVEDFVLSIEHSDDEADYSANYGIGLTWDGKR